MVVETILLILSFILVVIYGANTILVCIFIDDYKSKQEVRKAFLIPFYRGWIEIIETVRKLPDK